MNYYEAGIIDSLTGDDKGVLCIEGGASEVFSKITEKYPLDGSKIDWRRLGNFVGDKEWDLDLHPERFEKFFQETASKFNLSGVVTYVGDGLTDFSLCGAIEKFGGLLAAIFEVPQHHYFLGADLDWCMCFTMEGDMNFAFLPAVVL